MVSFSKLRQILSDTPYINEGGCAFAAVFMYKWLTLEGIGCEIVYLYMRNSFDSEKLMNNKAAISSGKYDIADSCSHAGILVEGKVIDSKRLHVPLDDYIVQVVPLPLVLSSLRKVDKWADWFDRRNIARIEKESGIKFPV